MCVDACHTRAYIKAPICGRQSIGASGVNLLKTREAESLAAMQGANPCLLRRLWRLVYKIRRTGLLFSQRLAVAKVTLRFR